MYWTILKELCLEFSRKGIFREGFDVLLVSAEFQMEPLHVVTLCVYYLLSLYKITRWPRVPFEIQPKKPIRQNLRKKSFSAEMEPIRLMIGFNLDIN